MMSVPRGLLAHHREAVVQQILPITHTATGTHAGPQDYTRHQTRRVNREWGLVGEEPPVGGVSV